MRRAYGMVSFMTKKNDNEDEELTVWERIFWYLIGVACGMPFALYAGARADSDRALIITWLAWVPCVWLLGRVGFWDFLDRVVSFAFDTLRRPAGIAGRLLRQAFGALGFLYVAVLRLIGFLLLFAFTVFAILGCLGVLWFGVSQFF